MTVKEIYQDAGLTAQEAANMTGHINGHLPGAGDFYDSAEFEKLYDYFTSQTNEMPYGTAKARDGDPDIWILERLAGRSY